jgi:N-acetylmuramoyl-L-alanine amidase
MLSPPANRQIDYFIIHHSATPNGRPVDSPEIHAWHKERGFDGIGYNYVILEDGKIEHGRPEYWVGAHTSGFNTQSIGICIIGTGLPNGLQESALHDLCFALAQRYPDAVVKGHRDLAGKDHTECPGFDVEELEWTKTIGSHI